MSVLILSRLHFLFFTLPFISWLPPRCWALELGAPMPQDTLSMTVFTGGALALPWTLGASDPDLFDLVLVGVQSGATVFPGIPAEDSPLKLLVKNAPQNYFFRALDNTTGATLAESSAFEVTAGPTMMPPSMSADAGDSLAWPTTTDVLAIPASTQSQAAHTSTTASRPSMVAVIVGVVLGSTILILVAVAVLIWRYRVRRQRAASAHPVLIDDDALSKDGSEEPPLLPLHAQLSPFPMSRSRPRMSPLRVQRLRPASENSSSSPTNRKSSSYPTSPASTCRPGSSYQSANKRPRMSQYEPLSYHRKLSYDLQPSSPLSSQSPQDRRASCFRDARRAATMPLPRGTPPAIGVRRLELQVELETALSETVYEKDGEPETPSKTPTRRRPLRCTSEPRPLSSEFGSTEGPDLDDLIRQARAAHEVVPENFGDAYDAFHSATR